MKDKIKQLLTFIKTHSSLLYFVIFFGSIYLIDWVGKNTDGFISWVSWIIILVLGAVSIMKIYSWQER